MTRWWVVAVAVAVVAAVAVAAGVAVQLRSRPPEPSAAAFCERLADARDLDASMATLDTDAIDGQVAALRSAAEVAPPEVAGPVATVLALAEVIADVVAANPTRGAEAVTGALRERRDELPSVTEAGRALEAYAEATCGLALSPPATG